MQSEKIAENFFLVAIPVEMFDEAEFTGDKVIQVSATKGKITISEVSDADIEDIACAGDCNDCPVCELYGENCPKKNN